MHRKERPKESENCLRQFQIRGLPKIEGELLVEYLKTPLAKDGKVRRELKLPENRYYSVSVWPVDGNVQLTLSREVRAKKISKSEQ